MQVDNAATLLRGAMEQGAVASEGASWRREPYLSSQGSKITELSGDT